MFSFKNNYIENENDYEPIIIMRNNEGNEYYFHEENVISFRDKKFAILSKIDINENRNKFKNIKSIELSKNNNFLDKNFEDEQIVYITRIDIDVDGKDIYVEPNENEFEEVCKIYKKIEEKLIK